jgi:hypothetical protein
LADILGKVCIEKVKMRNEKSKSGGADAEAKLFGD